MKYYKYHLIFYIVSIFFLECSNQESSVKEKIPERDFKELYYSKINFSYAESGYIDSRVGLPYIAISADEKYGFGIPPKYLKGLSASWYSFGYWSYWMNSLHEKNFGDDPFLKEKNELELRNLKKANYYLIHRQDFKVANYNLEKEIYKIELAWLTDKFTVRSTGILKNVCPKINDKTLYLDVPLKKEIAGNLRLGEASVFAHLKLIPERTTLSAKFNECLRFNQFAKDGCLEYGYNTYEIKFFPYEVLQVSFLEGGESFFPTDPLISEYSFGKKTPKISFACK